MKKVLVGFSLATALFIFSQQEDRPAGNSLPVISPPRQTFLIKFGLHDNLPTRWDGRVKLSQGSVLSLNGWRFEAENEVNSASSSWKCETKLGVFNSRMFFSTSAPPNLVTKGVLIGLEPAFSGEVEVTTARGSFVFRPPDLDAGSPQVFLDGQISVERVFAGERLTDDSHHDDYPSVLFDRTRRFWVAWIAYRDAKDIVRARYESDDGSWSETFEISEWGDHYQTTMAVDDADRVWVFWSSQVDRNWDIYGRSFDGRSWSPVTRITEAPEPDLFPKAISSPDGSVFLAWQGFRQGQSDIFLRSLKSGEWVSEIPISESPANDWQPAIAAAPDGRVWVAWDTYAKGNYDIFLRSFEQGSPGKLVEVTATPLFEARASVAVDSQGNPWVAWEEGGMNWGKDWARDDTFRGSMLYGWRRASIARVTPDGVKVSTASLPHALPQDFRYQQLPQPVFDPEGRLWVFFRVRTSVRQDRYDGWASGGRWESYVTRYDEDRWLPAVYLAESVGRIEVPVAIAAAANGLRIAWASDQRPFRLTGGFATPFTGNNSIFTSTILFSGPTPGTLALTDPRPAGAAPSPVHPVEKEDLERIRNYRIAIEGKNLRIYRGDLHRHTDISGDGSGDGSLLDFYRYALDAASLDYIMVGDHNMGGDDEYSWWRTQKSNDLFAVGGSFMPLYGYERSVAYPNGHRNVIFVQRGVRTLPIQPGENQGRIDTGPVLYPHLRDNKGIATSHSTATSQGTDWRDWDVELEPIVELYQGYHASYEYEGAPKAETPRFITRVHGSYEPAGFWWNALQKGLKLGVQASSDHISTHTSYASVYAPDISRQSLVDAMKARHTYAATDNIILDFRLSAEGKQYMMGDVFSTSRQPRFEIVVEGTSKIVELVLVRNEQFLYTLQPNQKSVKLTLLDTQPLRGQEAWYYIRVRQEDTQMAWSSPMWITYR